MTNIAPWAWGRKNLPAKQEEHPAYSLQRELNRIFEDFFRSFDAPTLLMEQDVSAFCPKVDLKETDKEIIVTAELPGLQEKDILVSLTHDTLTIMGDKIEEKHEDTKGHYRMERIYGSFRRTFPLPAEVQSENVTADFKNGVLTVNMPKNADVQKKAKTIPINKS